MPAGGIKPWEDRASVLWSAGLPSPVLYGFAVASVGLAALLRWALAPLLQDQLPFITFFIAVLATSYVARLRHSLTAAALGLLVAWYFFIPARFSFILPDPADATAIALYAVFSAAVALLGDRMRAAHGRSQRAEGAAQHEADRLHAMLFSIRDAVVTTDAAGRVTAMNPTAEALTNWTQADALGQPVERIFRIVAEQGGAALVSPVEQVLKEGRAVDLVSNTALLSRDGKRSPIEHSATPIFASRGAVAGAVLVFRDIAERRVLDDRLRESELTSRRLAAIVETSDDAIVGKDLHGIVTSWNAGAERIFGYSAAEMIGRPIELLIPEDRLEEEPAILKRLSEGKRVDHFETVRKRKDGELIDVSLTISPIRDEHGRVIGASKVAREITERNRATVVSRQLAAIVESSDDAIIGKDLHGIITSWNRGAEQIFGYTAEEMIGRPGLLLVPADRADEEPSILERVVRGEQVEHYETHRQRKDGTIIDVSLTISPIRGASGTIIGVSKVARDITQRVRGSAERQGLLESERAARAEAERATRLRDEFLAIVSHELRTPLNGILGWSQLLKRNPSDAEALRQGIAAIEQGARAQAQLIEDLLDMNRIMTGKLHLDIQNVRLATVIEAALTTLMPAAEAKGIRLQSTLASDVAPIKGDPTRLQQVVWNLVSNAVKFTPKGGRVQVLLERVNSHVEISVADSGMGIDPDFLPHVFDRFRQADSSTTRRHGGLGLGLAIVKQIVELHGGSIAVTSLGKDKGATFHVRLPVSIVRRPAFLESDAAASPPEQDVHLNDVRILVVDDDPGAAEIVTRMLEAHGANTTTATSGSEALERVADWNPDLLLSDIGMPGMDGYELVHALRRSGNTTPAIAVTAFARADDRIRSLQAGYNMHLSKPVDARELLTVAQSVLRSRGRLL